MREILFRGKRKDCGVWVEGNLFIPDKSSTPTQILIGTNIYRVRYDIIPDTIGQYTGLTDKNGKKIFEGDIIKFCTGLKRDYLVEFDTGRFVLTRNDAHGEIIDVCFYAACVIGNIHDNPELLKAGEEK